MHGNGERPSAMSRGINIPLGTEAHVAITKKVVGTFILYHIAMNTGIVTRHQLNQQFNIEHIEVASAHF